MFFLLSPFTIFALMSFKFKQFSLQDTHSAMKVGTDGVLLGAWADIPGEGRILDVGCGSGIIALMCAQRSSKEVAIEAIEIDAGAAKDALANFNNSAWHDRINLICADFRSYASTCSVRYNAIISNPPFFKDSLKPGNKSREIARHTDSLEYDDLFNGCGKILAENGKISLITTWESYGDIAKAATENRMFLYRRTDVFTTAEEKFPKRVLTEWSRTPTDYIWNSITINTALGTYSEEYKNMVGDFYINM